MHAVTVAVWTSWLLFTVSSPAAGGCVCPPMKRVDTGNLEMQRGSLTRQEWKLEPGGAEVILTGLSDSGKAEGSFWVFGGTSADFGEFEQFVMLNKTDKYDPSLPEPRAKVMSGGGSVDFKSERIEEGLRAAKKLKFIARGLAKTFKIRFTWKMPLAGQDGLNATEPGTAARYCIDSAVKAALAATKVDGYHDYAFVVSEAAWEGRQGKIALVFKKKDPKSVLSFCGSRSKKKGDARVEIKSRDALIEPDTDKLRRISVLVSARI